MNAPAPTKTTASPGLVVALAVVVVAIVHLASARWHVRYGSLNADEGFYAIATRSVANGEMPYRDFGFTQPPLVLYTNALPLRFAGFGLFQQRAVNGLWAALALALAAWWLARRTRPAWGLGLALVFSLSAPWMYFIHLGKTYGVTTLLAMLAAWAFLALRPGPRRNFTLGVLAALGVGARLPAAPFFGVLWLLALCPGRRPRVREGLAALGGVALAGAIVGLPFWLADRDAMKFWVVDFHRASVPLKDWSLTWREIAALAPAVWLLGALALGVVVGRRRFAARETGVLLAAGAALAANLLPGGVYEEYGVPFLLPLAAAAAALVYDECQTRKNAIAMALATTLAAAQLLTAPLSSGNARRSRSGTASAWLTPHAPPYNFLLPAQLAAARRVVETSLAPGAPFIGPNIILAAETGRSVPPPLRMGPFSFTVEIPPDQAARLHLATHEVLDEWFARRDVTLLAFFKRRELNYGWSMPSFDQLREDFHLQWFAPIRRDFATAYGSGDDFLLLVRKPAAPSPNAGG